MNIKTPPEIATQARDIGINKLYISRHQLPRLLTLSIFAGAFIALGALLSIVVGQGLPALSDCNPAIGKVAAGMVFPIGLLLIVTLGGELFTGNNALLMAPLVNKDCSAWSVIYNWALVWIGNFIGALLIVAILVIGTGTLDAEPWHTASANIATSKMALSWSQTFCRGIGANWCVCLAVWLALSSRTLGAKALACWIPVSAFVILGWEHCIANMFFIPAGIYNGADIAISDLILDNLVPATLGNIVGGAILVGLPFSILHRN